MNELTQKVLLVDDESSVLNSIVRQLRTSFDITTAGSGRQGLETIRNEGPFAVVVADYRMPEMNGVEFLRNVRKIAPDVVSVMLTGVPQLEVVVQALHQGQIFRFLAKPWSEETLKATISDCLERFRMNVEFQPLARMSETAQNEVLRDARTDRLMQIWNRATLDDYLATLDERTANSGLGYAIALADIDHFKKFNDNYGHQAGDDALRQVAQSMQDSIRAQDFIARYGGEEIAIICETEDRDVALAVSRRVRESVHGLGIPHEFNDDHAQLTISVGVALHDNDVHTSTADILARADEALYEAKRQGRNRTEVYARSHEKSTHVIAAEKQTSLHP
jgi:diguanylate cyclase (GGDEF)-like protein